ncbi:MAG: filamentous hemagglutinin N-terminal domain-containing protein, partial [Methylobacter sp.]
MNHTCRLNFNTAVKNSLPVAECALQRSHRTTLAQAIALALSSSTAFAAPAPTELPSGGQVTSGSASIAVNACPEPCRGGSQMDVNQASQNASINWQTFNIGQNAQVDFHQPNANAIAVNRIADTNGSQIMGRLNANGQIYLINPNGVLFGQGSQVNVGGLVASTLDISDADAASDKRTFSSKDAGGKGKIINQGAITAAEGGYVALLGGQVSNQGIIQARLGAVALAAGDKVSLDFAGDKLLSVQVDKGALQALAENKQLIQADGGIVLMTAKAADTLLASVVNNEGVIEARTVEEHNGVIKLLGDMDSGTVNVGGTLDASAPSPAVNDRSGNALPNAPHPEMTSAPSNTIHRYADTTQSLAEDIPTQSAETMKPVDKADGGTSTGSAQANGGFIETSAAHVKIADDAKITTKAANGQSGTWLIDPVDFTIAAGSAGLTTSGIGASTLSTALGGGNVAIATDPATAGNGDIFVNSAVSWSANKLTLTAHRNIAINANLNGSGTASLALQYGQSGGGGDYSLGNGAKVSLPAGLNFSTKNGAAAAIDWTVITDVGVAGDATVAPATMTLQGMDTNRAGNYVLGADINASGTSTWNANQGFSPVGFNDICNVGVCFTGKFDGLGHTISNLSINRDVTFPVGLFGNTENNVLQNVGLLNVNIYGGSGGTGALAGRMGNPLTGGTAVRNSYVDGGSVKARSRFVGGLVGMTALDTDSISYSYANVSVESSVGGSAIDAIAGGLVGSNAGSISYSYASGSVTGKAANPVNNVGIGGLVGRQAFVGSISNSYATGAVSAVGGGTELGGLVGQANGGGGSVTSSYWDKTTTGQATSANVTGGGGGDGTGLTTAQWSTLGPFGTTPSDGAWSTANWGTGNLYPGIKALPYITITASASQTYGSPASFSIASILDQTGANANSLVSIGGLTWSAGTSASTAAGTTSAVRGAGATGTGYQILYAGNLTVAQAPLTVTAANAASKTYDGLAWSGNNGVTYSGFVNDEGTGVLGGTLSFGGSAQGAVNAGNYAITPSGLSSVNYAINYVNGTMTINPKPVNITGSRIYDGTTAVSSGIFTVSNLVPGETLTLSGSGSVASKNVSAGIQTVTPGTLALVNGSGLASNYTLTGGTKTANITAKDLTVSGLSALSKIYDASTAATVSTANAIYTGLVVGDAVKVNATGIFADKNVAANKAVTLTSNYTGADVNNYTITDQPSTTANITARGLTVTASGIDKIYDGSTAAAVTLNDNRLADDVLTLSNTSAYFSNKNAATGKTITVRGITIGGIDADNYIANTVASTAADITVKGLTVSGLTANNKTYDGTNTATVNTASASLTGLVAGDILNVNAIGMFADKNVGAGKAVTLYSSYTGPDAGNYGITGQTSATADITVKSLTLNGLSANNKVYDTTAAATLSGTASITALGSDLLTLDGTGSAVFADKNVGVGKDVTVSGYSLSGADAGNYSLLQPSRLTADISAANLAVTGMTASNKVYDTSTAATLGGTATITALGSDLVALGGTADGVFADKNVGTGKAVTVSGYSLSGADAGNYKLVQPTGLTADITPANLPVTGLTANNKVYDATTVATLAGKAKINALGTDVVVLGGTAIGAFADKNVGAGKAVTVSGNSLSGIDAGNYHLLQQSGLTANIAKANLQVTGLGANNKVYDATTVAPLSGKATITALGADVVALEGTAIGAFADKNVGKDKTVIVSGNTLSGIDAGNYNLVQQSGLSADIAKANLSITGLNALNKVYDATTVAKLGGTAKISPLHEDVVT